MRFVIRDPKKGRAGSARSAPEIFVKREIFMAYTRGRQGLPGVSRPRALSLR